MLYGLLGKQFDDLYEYCTFISYGNSSTKKLVLINNTHTWLILSNKTVENGNPSIYYVSSFSGGIYIIKSILNGDITYQKDSESINKLKIISVLGSGGVHITLFHRGIKHKDPHPHLE
jgi:hypothetical protein